MGMPDRTLSLETGMVTAPLYPLQMRVVQSTAQFTAMIGGIGSGKSYTGGCWLLNQAQKNFDGTYLAVAPTYRMLGDSTIPAFFKAWYPILREADLLKADMLVQLPKPAKGKVLFRSGEEPDRMRGINATAAWLDEGAIMREYVYEIVIGRLRETATPGLCVTTTPKGRRHWTYRIFGRGSWDAAGRVCTVANPRDRRRPEVEMVRVEMRDNPFLPTEYIRMMEQRYSGLFAEQEIMGRFVAFEGSAFPISEDRHVRLASSMPPFSAMKDLVVGIDDGWTNPRAAGLWGMSSDDKLFGFKEFYRSRCDDEVFVGEMRRWQAETGGRISGFYVDPHAPRLISALEAGGLPAYPGSEKRLDSIRYLVSLFQASDSMGQPMIVLSDEMVNHISEFTSAVFVGSRQAQVGETRWTEDIVKTHDHAIDATRYVLFTVQDVSGAFIY